MLFFWFCFLSQNGRMYSDAVYLCHIGRWFYIWIFSLRPVKCDNILQRVSKWLFRGGGYRQLSRSDFMFYLFLISFRLRSNQIRYSTPAVWWFRSNMDSTPSCRWHVGLVHRPFFPRGLPTDPAQRTTSSSGQTKSSSHLPINEWISRLQSGPQRCPVTAPLRADLWPTGNQEAGRVNETLAVFLTPRCFCLSEDTRNEE